jgi:hypothetical protein
MIFLGIFYIIFTQPNMKQNFDGISKLWGFFAKYNPEISYLFLLFNIIIGLFLVSQGIIVMYLSDFIIKRKDKLTWVILFFSGLITWAGLLTISILLKNPFLIFLNFAGWLSFVFGMVLPIKYYLEKSYREY